MRVKQGIAVLVVRLIGVQIWSSALRTVRWHPRPRSASAAKSVAQESGRIVPMGEGLLGACQRPNAVAPRERPGPDCSGSARSFASHVPRKAPAGNPRSRRRACRFCRRAIRDSVMPESSPDRAPRRDHSRPAPDRIGPGPRRLERDCGSTAPSAEPARCTCERPPGPRETAPSGRRTSPDKSWTRNPRAVRRGRFETREQPLLTLRLGGEDVPDRSGRAPAASRNRPGRCPPAVRSRARSTGASGRAWGSPRTRHGPPRRRARHSPEPRRPRPQGPAPAGARPT